MIGLVLVVTALWAFDRTRRSAATRAEENPYAIVEGPLIFPASVATAPPELRAVYEFAARRPDVLHYLPCFCGCGYAHRSNYDCFIDEVRADGTVLIDDMGFRERSAKTSRGSRCSCWHRTANSSRFRST